MENNSGIYPVLRRLLVLPDKVEDVTEGGIVIPETELDKHNQAVSTGVVIAMGGDCFRHGTETVHRPDGSVETRIDGFTDRIGPGDRIIFAKFGGKGMPGKDGEQYRLINDVDVCARCESEVEFGKFKENRTVGAKWS